MAKLLRPGARPPSKTSDQPTARDIDGLTRLHREENFGRLESRARKLIKRYPGTPMLLMLHAAAQSGLGRRALAINTLQKLVAAHPGFADAQFNLGKMLIEADRLKEAATSLAAAVHLRPDADGFNSLGAVLHETDRIDEAIDAFQQACTLRPGFHQAHHNLGLAYAAIGKIEAAKEAFATATKLSPLYGDSHYQLAICARDLGQEQAAEAELLKALELEPNSEKALLALGTLYREAGRLDDAFVLFEKAGGERGAVRQLETLLTTGDVDRFAVTLAEAATKWPQHRWLSAVSSFGCHQWGIVNPHPFAPDPLSHVSVRSLRGEVDNISDFIGELMTAADQLTAVWENRTTRGGFQTYGNLFGGTDVPAPLQNLEQHIRRQIVAYRAERKDSDDIFVNNFPEKFGLFGWRVKLMRSGHQIAHIHPDGWMSGVFYLKIPDEIKDHEGSIVFSLHGFDYPIRNADVPEIKHRPRPGDLVLFPSSLFHRTVAFASDEQRQCIAFDVAPLE